MAESDEITIEEMELEGDHPPEGPALIELCAATPEEVEQMRKAFNAALDTQ